MIEIKVLNQLYTEFQKYIIKFNSTFHNLSDSMDTNVDCVNQDASDDTLEIEACNERNQGTELAVVY